jgi:hypothetical protein
MTTRVACPPLPPALAGSEGGGGWWWIQLTTAANDIDAHLLTGRLNQAGIETRAIKDRRAPGSWAYGGSNPWAPVGVMVRAVQLEDARLVLAEISLTGPDAVHRAERPMGLGPAFFWGAVAVILGVVLTLIALMQVASLASACDAGPGCDRPYGAPAPART